MGAFAKRQKRLAQWAMFALGGCLVAVLSALWINHQNAQPPTTAELHTRSAELATAFSADLSRMATEADSMAAKLRENPKAGFPTFMAEAVEPAFLFRDTSLVFWSHFDLVPDAAVLKGAANRVMRDKGGIALLHVRPFEFEGERWYAVVRKPLQRTYPVSNAYLKPGWTGSDLSGVRFERDSTVAAMAVLYGPDGSHVAGIEVLPTAHLLQEAGDIRLLIAVGLGLAFGLLAAWLWVVWFARRGRYALALFLWGVALLLVKGCFSLSPVRNGLDEFPLFSPRLYASSTLAPSLGDLLLTTLGLAAFAWMVFRFIFRTGWMRYVQKRVLGVSAVLTLAYFLMLLGAYRVMRSLYLHSQAVLDVARGFRMSWERVAELAIFITLAFTLFFGAHVVGRALTRLVRRQPRPVYFGIATAAGCMVALMIGMGSKAWLLETGGLLFLLAWLRLRLPEYLFRLRYQTYFYLFSIAILAAGAATQAYDRYRTRSGFTDRQSFARRLVAQGDPLAEYLLWDMHQRMTGDTSLQRYLSDSADYNKAEEYLRRTYSDPYFDQYALELGVFGSDGMIRAGQSEADRMTLIQRFVQGSMVKTGYEGVFFSHMPSEDVFKRYVALIEVPARMDSLHTDPGRKAGYVTLDLKMRRLSETSVFATLLVNGPSQAPQAGEKYSYAVYDSAGIVQQYGPFNYERGFSPKWLQHETPIEILRFDGWVHALFLQPDGQQMVVSAPDTFLRDAFTNFSFLLLMLVAFILAFVIGFALRQQRGERMLTFAGKIQIYLNAAFFLPLTVFGLVSFTLVELSLRADLNAGYLLRARNAAKSIEPMMEQLEAKRLTTAVLSQRLDDMARYTGLNASLYSSTGRLLYSSHPLIYRKGILSPYINPEALRQVVDEGLPETLLEERLGRLRYSSAYVAVRVPKSKRISAVLAVPFFEAGSELENQLSNAIATVVSSFTAVFIIFMVLSYFASQILVVPLKLITARLKRTTLGETEPLYWAAEDEIGLLVDGYNGMLRKLEASRAALAAGEKESAWREMAQQVAHEIKNPLTPMKLTVQQLQRVLGPDQPSPESARLQRPLAGLLEQIENLSDIAGSFSAFARMPQPKTELFDLARVVRRTAEIHRSNAEADVEVQLPQDPREAYVLGDEGIFQGVVTNLILNGMQAVPPSRRGHIEVCLERVVGGRLRLSVSDNGDGVPEDVQSKIFLPNFSTKFSGSGIGLALAKRGVEHAQGRIWFETIAEEGTTFYIELAEQPAPSVSR